MTNSTGLVEEWAVSELKRRLDEGERLRLVDVRAPWERALAVIQPSEFLDAGLVDELLAQDDGTPVVFYCHHGVRSARAAAHFAARGLRNPRNLAGGIDAWSEQVDPDVAKY